MNKTIQPLPASMKKYSQYFVKVKGRKSNDTKNLDWKDFVIPTKKLPENISGNIDKFLYGKK